MKLTKRIFLLALCVGGAVPAGASPTTAPRIVAAANAFLATLDDAKKSAVLFERGNTAQKLGKQLQARRDGFVAGFRVERSPHLTGKSRSARWRVRAAGQQGSEAVSAGVVTLPTCDSAPLLVVSGAL